LLRDSDGHNREAGESCTIEAIIQSEEAESILDGMGPDQEIGEDTAWVGVTLFPPAGNIVLECPAARPPDGFVQIPVH
jgi:hypothetical protein